MISPPAAASRSAPHHTLSDPIPSEIRTRLQPGVPWLLYGILAAILLWPFAGSDLKPAGDLHAVIASVVEARNALAEGQFPIRVAPHQLDGARYPFFQFYANFPYTVSGLLSAIPGVGPYTAWKITLWAALVSGATFTFACARSLFPRRSINSATIAGAAFISSPYMLTDIYARGAFAEAVAFNLLPAVLFFLIQTLRTPGVGNIVRLGVVWSLLGLTHNITYLYASVFFGMFAALSFPIRRQFWPRFWKSVIAAGAAAALQGVLVVWYLAPQVETLDQLAITAETRSRPLGWVVGRVPLQTLLSPVMAPPPGSTTPTLGVQIGWPILAGSIATIMLLVVSTTCGKRHGARRPRWAGVLSLFFLISCAMAWSPVDFWRFMPDAFRFIQFPYRLLAFATLWGSLSIACVLATWHVFRNRRWPKFVAMALIGVAASTYRPARLPGDADAVARTIARPVMGGLEDYRVVSPAGETTARESATVEHVRSGRRQTFRVTRGVSFGPVALPVLYYPRLLQVEIDKKRAAYRQIGPDIAVELPAGQHRVDVEFVGLHWANALSAAGWGCVIGFGLFRGVRSVRRDRNHVRPPLAHRWIGTGIRAGAVSIAFYAGIAVPRAIAGVGLLLHPPLPVAVSASRDSGPQQKVELAFDGDRSTEWAASGSAPITLVVTPQHTDVLERVDLEARAGGLYEAWQQVRIELFRDGVRVSSQDYSIPEAEDRPVVTLTPPAERADRADRVEFHFSVPVTKLRDGSRRVDANAVNPGYREIRLHWRSE